MSVAYLQANNYFKKIQAGASLVNILFFIYSGFSVTNKILRELDFYLRENGFKKCGRSRRNSRKGMAMKTIWHNPRCSKSRTALNLLKDTSVDVHVFHYLNESFTYEDLMSLIEKLSIPVIELVRTNEKIFRASGLTELVKMSYLLRQCYKTQF